MTRTALIGLAGVLLLAACGGSPTPTPKPGLPPTPTVAIKATPAATPGPAATLTSTPAVPTPMPLDPATPTPIDAPSGPPPIPQVGFVTISNTQFVVDIADDASERAQGLSGRESLDSDSGMWFVREREMIGSFWMRGMKFPIDIIWIGSDLRVVDITHSAPVPPPGAADAELPRYSPQAPAAFVLEINAGLAQRLGIGPRTALEFSRF